MRILVSYCSGQSQHVQMPNMLILFPMSGWLPAAHGCTDAAEVGAEAEADRLWEEHDGIRQLQERRTKVRITEG